VEKFLTNKKAYLGKPSCIFEFAKEADQIQPGHINMVGFGFDGTACFRKGTKDGPDGLREVSYGIESYSPYLDKDLEECAPVYDLGNLAWDECDGDHHRQWKDGSDSFFSMVHGTDLKSEGTKIVTIGGEHSISFAPIKTYLEQYEDLVLLHLDAHADLRDGYEGYHYSHASIIRRSLDYFKDTHQLIQYGIRSGTKEEYQWMRTNRTNCSSREDFLSRVAAIDPKRPIYLTLDLDYFDPSFLPGTGTPEAGGEDFHSFVKLMKLLDGLNLVGADVVELAPGIDPTGNSNVFAAKVLREILLVLS
jgi:agmatinase